MGGRLNDTDGEEEKDREETGELQGTGNPGDSGGGRKKGGPDHCVTVKIVNLKKIGPESIGILSLCLVLELHHTIMSNLWDLGGRTKRRRAYEIDRKSGTDFCTKAIEKEMTNVRISFENLDDVTPDEIRKGNIKPG